MNTEKMVEELKLLIDSKTAKCIWIETYEEAKVINEIVKLSTMLSIGNLPVSVWSHTQGLKKMPKTNSEKEEDFKGELAHPKKIFEHINKIQNDPNAKQEIFILRDLHLMNQTHEVIRIMRDIKEYKTVNYCPIIIVSPVTQIPMEHEKIFSVLELDIPDKVRVKEILMTSIDLIGKRNEDSVDRVIELPNNEEIQDIISALSGLTETEISAVIVRSTRKNDKICPKYILEEKIQLIKKSGALDYKVPQNSFDDIGGNSNFKQWISEVELSMSQEAQEFGCSTPKGYLALGVPGCSKTFSAEALANRWNVPFLKLNMSKIFDKLVGQSEKKIEQALKVAQACSPCVLLIDEIEKALSGTKSSNASDAGTTARVFSSILSFLNDNSGVYVVMTSNDVSQLPPELSRTGRIDAIWYFSTPTLEERKEIFKIHFKKNNKVVTDSLIDAAASASANFTGAEIEESVKSSVRKAFKRYATTEDKSKDIKNEEILSAIKEIVPIYKSSSEKIAALEMWANGRARRTQARDDDALNDSDNDIIKDLFGDANM